MRTLCLATLLLVCSAPSWAADAPTAATAEAPAPASTAPLQGEIRFHVEGMKKSGDGF